MVYPEIIDPPLEERYFRMRNFWYQIQRAIFTFIGNIKWAGIAHPFWFIINAQSYKIKGEQYRVLRQLIQPGDIVIRRFEGFVDKWIIPGFMNHGGIYIGGPDERVVHAISEGVIIEDILNFMRTDHMIVLRPPNNMIEEGLKKAQSIVGCEYDFNFDFEDHNAFSCTEVVDFCYPDIITPKRRFGKPTIVADDIVGCSSLTVVWDSRKETGTTTIRHRR